ncbi:MAG TPA: MerR family transcriptional regulator [Chitinophagaceae bacterium]|nr:MerR family transcriptional regulator [Chitinophagaceae bacterium]
MERYSVKQLARLAGVSVRTLHLYDQMGLLKPSVRTEKRYRYYGRAEALRLQQILFYKELELPLKGIGELLDDPQYDPLRALESHKALLEEKSRKLSTLLQTIDKTIDHLKNGTMLSTEELYEGLPREQAEAWRAEAREKWGAAVDRSENALRHKSRAEFEALKEAAAANWQRLQDLSAEDPRSTSVQEEIARHYGIIREFWGTAGTPDKQADAYAGLGDLYVSDPRYTAGNGAPNPQLAAFLRDAMHYYARKVLRTG